jgi:hypothetical protein
MSEEKPEVSRMTFFDIMASTMYVYGTENDDKPVPIEEMLDYIRSLARLVKRSTR